MKKWRQLMSRNFDTMHRIRCRPRDFPGTNAVRFVFDIEVLIIGRLRHKTNLLSKFHIPSIISFGSALIDQSVSEDKSL